MTTFRDSTGTEWTVSEFSDPTLRKIRSELLRHPEYRNGWLLFQSATEKRRLADFPEDWEQLDAAEMEQLCRLARPALSEARMAASMEMPRYRA